MTLLPALIFAVISGLIGLSAATELQRADYTATCQEIAAAVSSASKVYYSGSFAYTKDNEHWASSSSQPSACSFEPATAQDVGIALQLLGKNQTPFAVRSGGHTANSGFSSTPGVQIALFQFSEIVYDANAQTATIGMGLIWVFASVIKITDLYYHYLYPRSVVSTAETFAILSSFGRRRAAPPDPELRVL